MDILDWLAKHTNYELFYYSPYYGDDDDQDCEWRVTSVNGGINDREWTIIGRGETPYEALMNASDRECTSLVLVTIGANGLMTI